MDVGKLSNYINTVLCVIIFLWSIFLSIFASHRSRNFVYIPINWYQSQVRFMGAMAEEIGKASRIEKFDGKDFEF